MQKKRSLLFHVFATAIVSVFNLAFAVEYPAEIFVPVTYYDFHSDRTNPEFEQRNFGKLRTGMVATTLGEEGKPTLGATPYLNYGINYWFRSWENIAKSNTIPDYNPSAGYKEAWYVRDPILNVEGWEKDYRQTVTYMGTKTVNYDTAFKNIVIQDSLRFVHIGKGVYEYSNNEFFPLDNRGFGNEWNRELGDPLANGNYNHNYSFTMELHCRFVKVPGLRFDFSGDDDVWVFADKQLKIDLGGIHEEISASFLVDNISGLENGKSYDLDVFYAERHSAYSHIRITTNMIFAPSDLRLYRYPGTPDLGVNVPLGETDTLPLGQPVSFYGHVFDSSVIWHPEYNEMITWEIIDNNGNPGLNVKKGPTVNVTATKPNSEIVLIAHFKDPNNPSRPEVQKRITLFTRKGELPSYELRLYGKAGTPGVSGNIPIGATVSVAAGKPLPVFGHVFDASGVWQSQMDQYIKWKILETGTDAVLKSASGEETSVTLTKSATVTLVASFSDPTNSARPPSETRLAVNLAYTLSDLRLYRYSGMPDVGANVRLGKTDTIPVDQPISFYGHLFDSAGVWHSEYDNQITWETTDNGDPGLVDTGATVNVTATKYGSEIVLIARFKDPSNPSRPEIETQITLYTKKAVLNLPYELRLYGKAGDPDLAGNIAISAPVTVTTGQPLQVFGHIFDSTGTWLPQMDQYIKWKILETGTEAVLKSTTGEQTSVTLSKFGSAVTLVGTFSDPTNSARPSSEARLSLNLVLVLSDLRLYRYPGAPDVGANVRFGGTDTIPLDQPVSFYGHLFDSAGVWHEEYDNQITWETIDNNGNPGLNVNKGANVNVTATKSGSEIVLIARFKDLPNPSRPDLETRITLYTKKAVLYLPYELRLYGNAGAPDVSGNPPIAAPVSVTAGNPLSLFGYLFDSTGTRQTQMEQHIKWRILENGTGAVIESETGVQTSVTITKSGTQVTLIASFSDPTNTARPPSEARVTINVLPEAPTRLEIIEKSVPKIPIGDDKFVVLDLGKGEQMRTIYAILRDRFGNFIRLADRAFWKSEAPMTIRVSPENGNSTNVSKGKNGDGEESLVIAVQDGLSDTLRIMSPGNSSIGASPNPFIPGVTEISPDLVKKYPNVFKNHDNKGTLIGVESPSPLVADNSSGSQTSYGKVVIYDCMGNVVRADLKLVLADTTKLVISDLPFITEIGKSSRLYGVVWDGKNTTGRYVGVGVYLWVIKSRMENGQPFSAKIKVGRRK